MARRQSDPRPQLALLPAALAGITTLALPLAAPAAGQQANTAAEAGPVMGSVGRLYAPIKRNIVAAAEQVSEELYAFRPTEEVRSFGQLIGHVTNTHYNFCSSALGEERPVRENFEERTTKASLVEALKASFEYCDRAYTEVDDAGAAEIVALFSTQAPRVYPLIYNVAHDNEHYGNIVTYMRLNGLVPPSSQPRS